VCYAPSVETGPKNNGGEFLEPPILTTPQFNPWSPFQYGGIKVEGAKKSTVLSKEFSTTFINIIIQLMRKLIIV